MYSVVLMMALTGGGDVPALGHGCHGGCYGCYGGGYGSCYGGGHHGCHGGRQRGHHGCHGGCYGSSYNYGCCGGGGHKHQRRGHGCCGCYGGGYGYGCVGGMGGYGYGCVGGVGGMGGAIVPNAVVPGNVAPTTAPPAAPAKNKTSLENSAPATLIVTVPADARLSIDGEVTTSTSTERVFVSPALNFGREYHYTLQAEFQKDGKTVKTTKEVAIKAGEETRVRLDVESLVSR